MDSTKTCRRIDIQKLQQVEIPSAKLPLLLQTTEFKMALLVSFPKWAFKNRGFAIRARVDWLKTTTTQRRELAASFRIILID
jgi:hypothetical protein